MPYVQVFTDASGDPESAEVYFVNGQIRKPLKRTFKMSGSQLKTLLLFMPGGSLGRVAGHWKTTGQTLGHLCNPYKDLHDPQVALEACKKPSPEDYTLEFQ